MTPVSLPGMRIGAETGGRMENKTMPPSGAEAIELKACCAAVYQSDWARLLLGESFHPGGCV